jgi:hypothetical protein
MLGEGEHRRVGVFGHGLANATQYDVNVEASLRLGFAPDARDRFLTGTHARLQRRLDAAA